MDALKREEIINKYLEDLDNNLLFKELIKINEEIKNKYFYLLSNFQITKSELEKANKKYSNYNDLKNKYQIAKTNLFSKEEVKRYFEIRNKLEDLINNDLKSVYEDVVIKID